MSNESDEAYLSKVKTIQNELQQRFDDFVRIESDTQLSRAQEILSRIGTIDAATEGLTRTENQRDLSIKFHWGHDHKFNDDLAVSGRMGKRHINLMAQFLTSNGLGLDHFQNKNVIDVGCWTGGTTLLLKAMGANKVLALEEVQKYAQAASDLIQDVYNLDGVLCEGTNLYDLETDEKYDIAYFPGVVYHLSDPVLGLRRLFNAVKDGGEIFVESAGIVSDEPICRYEGNRTYHKSDGENANQKNRGGWNWFLPSAACLKLWMIEAGFEDVVSFQSPGTRRVFGYGKRQQYLDITRAGFSVRDIE